ncbi:hypothetical protein F0562_002016 [Nyssa sinensis]|uniref:Uncharacterized protein n=1 Tax=Nyssa sinensis TaxID=561372 RepID=A0A5J5C8K8_9ASTE|nr:hypothetical protein F0562_002016 [Nyssa sinensis]
MLPLSSLNLRFVYLVNQQVCGPTFVNINRLQIVLDSYRHKWIQIPKNLHPTIQASTPSPMKQLRVYFFMQQTESGM